MFEEETIQREEQLSNVLKVVHPGKLIWQNLLKQGDRKKLCRKNQVALNTNFMVSLKSS